MTDADMLIILVRALAYLRQDCFDFEENFLPRHPLLNTIGIQATWEDAVVMTEHYGRQPTAWIDLE